jgi:glycosyltransferase involved in cell wall biosynthesis
MAFADHVIVSNHLWHDKLVSRSVAKPKCSVFVNHVDPAIFYRRPRSRNNEKLIVVYAGVLQRHQGLDIAIEAFARLKKRVPNAEFHIYGDGTEKANLVRLANRLGLNGSVAFPGCVSLEQVPEIIANADLGVVPKRADSFGNEAYSTKIMELMSQGIPVVAARTRIDAFYFDDTVIRFFRSGDIDALAEAMLEVVDNQQVRSALVAAGLDYVRREGWDSKKRDYLYLVDSLMTETFEHFEPAPLEGGETVTIGIQQRESS